MAGSKWVACSTDKNAAENFRSNGYSRIISILLANRGFKTADDAGNFFSSSLEGLHDPMLMKGMDAAVPRILSAVRNHEKITVYGDYDVDGVTAAALLTLFLRSTGAEVYTYIPERESEGYGLNVKAVDNIAALGSTLIITVDTGISAIGEALEAKSLGLDLIITDHHEPRSELPQAYAVIDPKQHGCPYPFRELSGVGVAFKLSCALQKNFSQQELFLKYGDLVCLGTVADVVPLTGENRIFVKNGLPLIEEHRNAGIASLCDVCGISGKRLSSMLLAFTLAPRINAGGRMGSSKTALRLLLCEDKNECAKIAQSLEQCNRTRQETEKGILEEVIGIINNNPGIIKKPVIIVSGRGWHNGVVGIAASRVVDTYGKPCILVSFKDGEGRASCRSVPGFDIFKALSACSEFLEKYGGHTMAAGFTIREDNYEAFTARFDSIVSEMPYEPVSELKLECELLPEEINFNTASGIAGLEPFGCANPQPLFLISGASVLSVSPLSGGKHLKIGFKYGGRQFSALLFNCSRFTYLPQPESMVDLAASLEIDTYNGRNTLSIYIRGVRETVRFIEQIEMYKNFRCSKTVPDGTEFSAEYCPSREEFAAVYRYFVTVRNENIRLEDAFQIISGKIKSMNFFKMLLITDIFEETGLISTVRNHGLIRIGINENLRVDLNSSSLLQKIKLENSHG